jgi:hypothetical protein
MNLSDTAQVMVRAIRIAAGIGQTIHIRSRRCVTVNHLNPFGRNNKALDLGPDETAYVLRLLEYGV